MAVPCPYFYTILLNEVKQDLRNWHSYPLLPLAIGYFFIWKSLRKAIALNQSFCRAMSWAKSPG